MVFALPFLGRVYISSFLPTNRDLPVDTSAFMRTNPDSIRFALHRRSTHTSNHHLHDCAPSARTYKVAYGEKGKCKRGIAKTR